MPISAGIPKRFNDLLKLRGYSRLIDFINQSKLPKTTIYSVASGKTTPGIDTIELLCDELDVDVSDFFSYAKKKRKVEYAVSIVGKEELIEAVDSLDVGEREELIDYLNFLLSKRNNGK